MILKNLDVKESFGYNKEIESMGKTFPNVIFAKLGFGA